MKRFDGHSRLRQAALVLLAVALVLASGSSFALDVEAPCADACCCCCGYEAPAPADAVSNAPGCSCQSAPFLPVSAPAVVVAPDTPQSKRPLSLPPCSVSSGMEETASFQAASRPPLRAPLPHDTLVTQFLRINC